MGSANRGGFVLDKGDSTEYDFGLGLKMMMMVNHQNPNRETAANADFNGDRDISSAGGCSGGGGNYGPIAVDDSDSSSFRSWGGRVFTASQRQELERQTMIYKYMAASIPVPSELLVPMNYKYPSNGRSKDQEPWRCKRTDGKKWRCSKDAAPDHKYCERHCHKTRPKSSRKLVESSPPSLSSSISTRRVINNKNNNTLISSSTSSPISNANLNIKSPFSYNETSQAMYMPQQYINSRYPDYFMKREAHHNDQNPPTVSPLFGMDQMTSISTSTDFMGNGQNHSPLPRQFLDVWSSGDSKCIDITGKSVVSDSSSLLTLSMAGGAYSEVNEEGPAQLGMGLFGSERDDGISIDERYAWMGSLAPGGPLAEALCLGMIGSDCAQGGPPGGLGFMK